MKIFILALILVMMNASLKAQSTEDSVKAAVNFLFDAMKNADAGKLEAAFADSAVLQTIGGSKDGNILIKSPKLKKHFQFEVSLMVSVKSETITFLNNFFFLWSPLTCYADVFFTNVFFFYLVKKCRRY